MSDDNFFKIYFNQVRKKRARTLSFLLKWFILLLGTNSKLQNTLTLYVNIKQCYAYFSTDQVSSHSIHQLKKLKPQQHIFQLF